MGPTAEGMPDDDGGEQEWIYLALDVHPARFGDILGKLNRTVWMITGSEELDENRQPLGELPTPPTGQTWQRVYAKKRIVADVQGWFG